MIFSIETSCDETSTAILNLKGEILSHIVVNQQNHKEFGGVVPEIASRAHLQILQLIIPKSFKEAKKTINDIDIFCATCGPGLIGGLLVGSTLAKSMAISVNKPFFPINHLEGHLLSPLMNNKISFPYLALLITGGHTQIYIVKNIGDYFLLGETVDDAVGETFDKVAKLLKYEYPGGPKIEIASKKGGKDVYKLPHPFEHTRSVNFSFSGIKTAVSLIIKKQKRLTEKIRNDIAASFQNKIIEILIKRTEIALNLALNKNYPIKDIVIVGGVAANKKIYKSFDKFCIKKNCKLIVPPLELCGDNAAMIGWACLKNFKNKKQPNLNFNPNPRWTLEKAKIV